jgi:hypothetical protein
MSCRDCVLIAFVLCGGLLLSPRLNAQTKDEVKLGETREAELKPDNARITRWSGNEKDKEFYSKSFPVTLKAGQSINISVTVIGKTRGVGIALEDPTGKVVSRNPNNQQDWRVKTNHITVEEVHATGKYTITVASDLIGPFSLRVTELPSNPEGEIKAVEQRISQLERELANLEAKLKVLKQKTKSSEK